MIAPATSATTAACAPAYRIEQAIFHGVAAADGARVVFASLTDGRCALLVNDRLVASWGNDVYGIEVAVCEYLEMTGATPQPIAARVRPRPRPPTRSRLQAQMNEQQRSAVGALDDERARPRFARRMVSHVEPR
jgi:hypothetical protein